MAQTNAHLNRKAAIAAGAGGFVAAATGLGAPRRAAAAGPQTTVFTGVTVVDTYDGSLHRNMAVAVTGTKIAKVVPAGDMVADRSVTLIDARGKYLVPGYNDYHAHPLSSSDPQGSLTLLLANGITGFREMGAWNGMLEQRRAGTLVPPGAPELLELASGAVNPGNVRTPDQAAAYVQAQHDAGADFIKIIEYAPAVFFAIADACKRNDTRFIGHLSPAVDVRQAIAAGMVSIEHMGPRDAILLGCSTNEAALRATIVAGGALAGGPPGGAPAGPVPADVIARSVANPVVNTSPAELARYKQSVATFDEARMHELIARFAAAGTWQVPTLIRVRTMEVGDDARYRNDPHLQYVPTRTQQMWAAVSQQFGARFSADDRDTLARLNAQCAALVKPFKRGGAKMMAGSDLGGGFVVPGFGLHDEFDLLADAGLTPLEILQMTTLNGAQYLGREHTMGSVAAGKDANLVLLDANPIESVQHLHRIAGAMRAGTYYSAAALDSLKRHTAERVASGVAYTEPAQPICC